MTIFVAAEVLLIVLQEIMPDGGLEEAETYCLIGYIVGLCVCVCTVTKYVLVIT
jgi:hypothetical protein